MTSPLESVDFPMDDGDSMKDQLLSRYQEKVEDLQSELENCKCQMRLTFYFLKKLMVSNLN